MSAINLTPEAVTLVNSLCNADNLADDIRLMEYVEDELQQAAYALMEDDKKALNLYTCSFQLKERRKKLQKLLELVGSGGE